MEPASVMVVTIDTDDDLGNSSEQIFTESQPYRCKRGHWLLPGHMIAGSVRCSCARRRHTTWECECGDLTYAPALKKSCALGR
jgi:hypothetical protein